MLQGGKCRSFSSRGSHGAGWTPGVLIPQNLSWLERQACKEIRSPAKEWLGAATGPAANSCSYAPTLSHMDSQSPRHVRKPSRTCWGDHLILFLPVSCRFAMPMSTISMHQLQTRDTVILISSVFWAELEMREDVCSNTRYMEGRRRNSPSWSCDSQEIQHSHLLKPEQVFPFFWNHAPICITCVFDEKN